MLKREVDMIRKNLKSIVLSGALAVSLLTIATVPTFAEPQHNEQNVRADYNRKNARNSAGDYNGISYGWYSGSHTSSEVRYYRNDERAQDPHRDGDRNWNYRGRRDDDDWD